MLLLSYAKWEAESDSGTIRIQNTALAEYDVAPAGSVITRFVPIF